MPCSMNRFLESIAPYRLYDEQQEGVSVQELKQKEPWKISDKQLEAFRLKVCLCTSFLTQKKKWHAYDRPPNSFKNFFFFQNFIYSLREK